MRNTLLGRQLRSAVIAGAVFAACAAIAAPLSDGAATTAGVLTVGQVRTLFSAHGIELEPSTLTKARSRFLIPASLSQNVVVLVPEPGHAQGLSDLVILVWTHPSKAQQASATWVHALQDRDGWFAVDYNVIWSSTREAETGSLILHAITDKIIVEECMAGGQSATACAKLIA